MCGITGFVDTAHIVDGDNLKKALASLAHPDKNHTGFVFEQKEHFKAGLASLPSLHPKPQMFNSTDGLYSICLNGSIYNYLSLRETLIKYGVIFNTLTDTEVLLAAYIKWGHKLFDKIEGAYAFAILDRKLNQLLLARDVIGSKSLFYHQSAGFYAFSSEIRTLFCYPNITKVINPNALTTYFRSGYFAGDETIYQQIFAFKRGPLQ
ncbi:Asparagine synthetase [glutamine-hydrolyzing] 3 [compost metagenome]